jgi:NAD-dependent dihydropyrimidine dehydrogenase PreA subunit
MPGLFIDVRVDPKVAKDLTVARELEEVCPVGIFEVNEQELQIVEKNLDECVLCDLCLEVAPADSVSIDRLYDH